MRRAFTSTLVELAAHDPRLVLLTADLGYTVLEAFAERFPSRFFNVGVAEQNMVGLATGLAEAGFIPFLYTIATFASLRGYEFIRNGPILHCLPVRIVGIGGGFEYGHSGITHHALEDIGVMRVQPGITLIAPADHCQARTALLASWDLPGPIYYRLGKDDTTVIPGLEGRFELGRVQIISEGTDLLLITTGSITAEVATTAAALRAQGIACTVAIVASLTPAPVDDLVNLLARFRLALTVEAHYLAGGLGSLVAEIIGEQGLNCRIVRCGVKTPPDGKSGDEAFFHQMHGLSKNALIDTARRAVQSIVKKDRDTI